MKGDSQYPDDSENVLTFTKRFDTNADIKDMRNFVEDELNRDAKYCHHDNILVSEYERSIKCRKCGAALDTFDYILSIARKETRLDWELRSLRTEITDHRKGLENLKREETNCRARIKTAQFRLNDVNMALIAAGERLVKAKGDE